MSVRLQIHDKEFLEMIAKATSEGIARACVYLQSQAKLALNVPNTGVRVSADSVKQQAGVQLGGRSKGLVKITAQRKWKADNGTKQTEDVTAWYQFDANNFKDRVDKKGNVRQVKSVTIYPYPSKPGESPRKRTGWLQRHVLMELSEVLVNGHRLAAGRVGVGLNAMYGLYLELGTRKMKARPWLVATLMKHKAAIGLLMSMQS